MRPMQDASYFSSFKRGTAVWTAENIFHTYLHILQNTSLIYEKVFSGGGEAVRTPAPSP